MPVACRAEHVGWLGTAQQGGGGVCTKAKREVCYRKRTVTEAEARGPAWTLP